MNRSFRTTTMVVIWSIVCYAPVCADDLPPLAVAPLSARQAKDLQRQWARQLGQDVVQTNSIGMKIVLLPPGEFTMGRTEEQLDKLLEVVQNDPQLRQNYGGIVTWSMLMMPAHRVRLTKPFYMGATEVTVGQFRQFVQATGYKTEAEQGLVHGKPYQGGRPLSTWRKPMAWRKPPLKQQDDEPVMHLCWNDCVAFCQWLSKREGVQYDLPTEAEWEYACRAGTTTPWSFGDMADFERQGNKHAVWSDGGQKFDVPQSVAARKPNAFGLYDLHGNMWEYVADWWHRLSYKEAPLNDPTGPAVQSEKNDQRRIIRGSSFDWGRWGGDSAYRMRITQRSNQHPHMSFRVAMRIQDVEGVAAAVDADEARRRQKRDPGAESEQVMAALNAAAVKDKLPKEVTIDLGGGVNMPFVRIPAGSFLMGSEKGPPDERPLHRVVISQPFYMAKYEVTQSQWEAVMGTDRRLTELSKGDNEMSGPSKAMNGLSWHACQQFVSKLKGKAPGHNFALPTEAQWEYACRAGSATEFHFGDDASELDQYAWYQGNMNWPGQPGFRGKAFYHDVGQKKPNPWGLYDMHGGVWEWCGDRYDADYYFDSPLVDPSGPDAGRFRVLRGGSWFRYPKYARSAYRRFFHPESDGDGVTAWILDFGCRVVINRAKEVEDEPVAGTTKPQQAAQRAKIDAPVSDFRLRDLMQDEQTFVTLSQFRNRQVVVLVSIQSRCPITWRYVQRIGKLYQDYRKKGVAVVMIRSSATDSEDRIRRYAEDKNLDMPLLFDEANKVADYFGTQGTPYFYVIDKQGVLRYEGIFDNNQVSKRVELKPETATAHYVREALDAVLAGRPVKRKSVPLGST